MTFSEFTKMLYPFNNEGSSPEKFVLQLIDYIMAPPSSESDKKLGSDYNPLSKLHDNTLSKIYNGTRPISKKAANAIYSRWDSTDFVGYMNQLSHTQMDNVIKILQENGIETIDDPIETCTKLFESILMELASKTKSTNKKKLSIEKANTAHGYPCNTVEAVFDFFNQAILDYRIKLFVENVDPTGIMDIDYIEKCDSFIKHIKDDSWLPSTAAAIKETQVVVHKIYQFCEILGDYTTYLGCHMRSVDQVQAPATFVPIYREENIQWSLDFEKQVQDYRRQLAVVYQEICTYVLY